MQPDADVLPLPELESEITQTRGTPVHDRTAADMSGTLVNDPMSPKTKPLNARLAMSVTRMSIIVARTGETPLLL